MPQRPHSPPRPAAGVLAALFFACFALRPAAAADVRVGDPGAAADPAKFDDKYPDMKEWAAAGVRGGIPARSAGKVVKTVKPGDDLQAAIDEAAGKGGGVVLLTAGTYPVTVRLNMASGVVLRGEDKDKAVLENAMKASRMTDRTFSVRFDGTQHAGLEDLTFRHGEVAKLGLKAYAERTAGAKNNPGGVADLHVGGVQMERAEDCWVDNVAVLHSGSHPLELQGKYLTVRDCLVDGALNKGEEGGPAGSGNVYFAADHGLFYNNTVRNTRHALVLRDMLAGGACKFNAVVDCNFEGDVNFHGNKPDEGHNLFEGTLVHSPPSHGWPAWSYWKRTELGPDNLVYKSIGWGGPGKDTFASTDPEKVYTFTGMHDPNVLGVVDKPAPKAGTLYAVNAARPTKPESLGAWPKTPSEALAMFKQRETAAGTSPKGKCAARAGRFTCSLGTEPHTERGRPGNGPVPLRVDFAGRRRGRGGSPSGARRGGGRRWMLL